MTGYKMTLHYPVELPNGSRIRAVMVRLPDADELADLRRDWHDGRPPAEVFLDAYSRATDLDLCIIEEFDSADLRRIDDLLTSLTQQEN